MSDSSYRFDVSAFTADRSIGGFHVWVAVLVGLVLAISGYDLFFIGNVLPAVAKGLGVPPSGMTAALTAQAAAVALGGFLLSLLCDKWGRRTTLLLSIFAIGGVTMASSLCTDTVSFAVSRVIAGFFIGGIVPCATPIVSEFAPAKYKGTMVTLSYLGLPLGGMVGALISTSLTAHYGWQSAFLVAGAVPTVIGLICLFALPESVVYRVVRNPADPKIPNLLRRLSGDLSLTGKEVFYVDDSARREKVKPDLISGLDLFRDGRTVLTVCLWGIFGLTLASTGLSIYWFPTILVDKHGLTLVQTGHYMALIVTSSLIAQLFYGQLLDRIGYVKVLVASYLLSTVALLSFALVAWDSPMRFAAAIVIGLTSLPAQTGMVAFATSLYPVRIKAAGLGWAWGFGNGLALAAPIIGGYLVAQNISFFGFLVAVAIPWILAIVLLLVAARERSRLQLVEA